MRRCVFAWLALLSATAGLAQSSGFLLGVDYSERYYPGNSTEIATDASGALYNLVNCQLPPASCVTKVSADGKTLFWQNALGFVAVTMAVDPNGGVYVIPAPQPGDTSIYVAKLNPTGTGFAWKTSVGSGVTPGGPVFLAADPEGRAYVAGSYNSTTDVTEVVRLNAAGNAVDYATQVAGGTASIAVDGSGAAFVLGYTDTISFVERLAPDGSAGFYSVIPQPLDWVVVDSAGDAVVYGVVYTGGSASGLLQRFDSTGAVTSSTTVAPGPGFGLDAAGNAYIAGSSDQLFRTKNGLTTCGSGGQNLFWLSVYASDGSLLQSTYIPDVVTSSANGNNAPLIAIGPESTVYVVAMADLTVPPTQTGPFGTSGMDLVHLSPNANAQTFPLACLGNSATYGIGPIAPGGFVTLFGNGLGPQQGVLTQATPQSPYPTQTANVQVTFDSTPAPLLWVQDQQINVVAPWSLTPGQTTQVCVSYKTVKTNCLTWPVAQTAPGVFTVDGTYAAALNQDGTVNSANNPASLNSTVMVFATGLGPITPAQADGTLVAPPLPTNALPVQAYTLIPGFGEYLAQLDLTYAGPASNFVAGMSQIAFKVSGADYTLYSGFQIWLTVGSSGPSQTFQIYVAGQ
jgi:uncharacterized protein (TIGR03437 family)